MQPYIISGIIIFILTFVARWFRGRYVKPTVTDGVQKPGGFDRLIIYLITGLTVLIGLLAMVGVVTQNTEMAVVCSVITLIFLGVNFWIRQEYNLTYEENEDYFIATIKGKEYKVYYHHIVDWQPGYNEILISDQTKEEEYIKVNISIFKPIILLKKIADMTFEGKFIEDDIIDATKEDELVQFYKSYNYSSLIENESSKLGL